MTLRCLWVRNRIAAYVDQTLSEGRSRAVARHLSACARCRQSARRQERVLALVRGLAAETAEPEWSGFWPGIRTRILSEDQLVGRPPTHATQLRWVPRVPRFRPGWPLAWLPRLVLGGAMAGILLLGLFFWRSDYLLEAPEPGVVVRALETANPDTSVMVFSAPEQEMTVIWVFGLDPSADQSRRQSEEMRGTWRRPSLVSSWS